MFMEPNTNIGPLTEIGPRDHFWRAIVSKIIGQYCQSRLVRGIGPNLFFGDLAWNYSIM